MDLTSQVVSLSNQELKFQCWEQKSTYQRSLPLSNRYHAYELLRRVVFGSDESGAISMDMYLPWLISKIRPMRGKFQHEDEEIPHEAMMLFFNCVTPQTWHQFETLGQLLTCIEKYSYSVVMAIRPIDSTIERHGNDVEDVTMISNSPKPKEISKRCPIHFSEITGVYKRKHNLIDGIKCDKLRQIIA